MLASDDVADGGDRLIGHLHAVRPHIGDEPLRLAAHVDALIEPLGHLHGAGGREAKLARGLLLHRRGRERRRRVALDRFGLDARDGKVRLFEMAPERVGLGLGADAMAVDLVAVRGDEPRLEAVARRRRHGRADRPVFDRLEGLDLGLALADQPQRDRLHPTGRARARQLAPQDRRQREPDQIAERAAGQIGIHQRIVDRARARHRLVHRLAGDGVEHDPFYRFVLQDALLAQDFEHMPGNRFAFAVRVGGEDQPVSLFRGVGDLLQPLGRLGVGIPMHGEFAVRLDRAILRRKVADMAVGRQHLKVLAEIFVDRLRLGRRFDDDKIRCHACSQ